MINIRSLAFKIYQDEPVNEPLRAYYLNYLPKIKEFGKYDFLVENFNNFGLRANINLMLTLPELWKDFAIDDWIKLFERIHERPEKLKLSEIDTGKFTDIVFFCKYLELDGIDLFLKYSNASSRNKEAVINYANIFPMNFAKSIFDIEALDGTEAKEVGFEMFGCNLSDLNIIKKKFLEDSRVIEFPTEIKQSEAYIKTKYRITTQSKNS